MLAIIKWDLFLLKTLSLVRLDVDAADPLGELMLMFQATLTFYTCTRLQSARLSGRVFFHSSFLVSLGVTSFRAFLKDVVLPRSERRLLLRNNASKCVNGKCCDVTHMTQKLHLAFLTAAA